MPTVLGDMGLAIDNWPSEVPFPTEMNFKSRSKVNQGIKQLAAPFLRILHTAIHDEQFKPTLRLADTTGKFSFIYLMLLFSYFLQT